VRGRRARHVRREAISLTIAVKQLLDRITWHALSGPHAKFATGTVDARRYAPGFSPILGFADAEHPNFAALADYCEPGEHFYCDGWTAAAPVGWRVDAESTMFKMLWEGAMPASDEAPEAVRLGPEHVAQALELATLTQPGPFGPRTIELASTSAALRARAWWQWRASACVPARCARSAASARIPTSRAAASRAV
jgi:hypothetical protein